jgi:hypothetical protein
MTTGTRPNCRVPSWAEPARGRCANPSGTLWRAPTLDSRCCHWASGGVRDRRAATASGDGAVVVRRGPAECARLVSEKPRSYANYFDAIPVPIWRRDCDYAVVDCNSAHASAPMTPANCAAKAEPHRRRQKGGNLAGRGSPPCRDRRPAAARHVDFPRRWRRIGLVDRAER